MGLDRPHYVNGFPSLAAFIASDRDKTTLIFKRFDILAARNLLHLQSQLARLQHKLDLLDQANLKDEQDSISVLRTKQNMRNWDDFVTASETSAQERERFELYKCIQATLKDSRKLLLLRLHRHLAHRMRFNENRTGAAFRKHSREPTSSETQNIEGISPQILQSKR
jgi:hypothetical protein